MRRERFYNAISMKLVIAICALTTLLAPAPALAIREGEPAPAFSATLLDGRPFALEESRGKVVVINFWATWCAPCRAEMPAFDEYYRRHQSEGLEVVAISYDRPQDEAKAREVMKAFAFPGALARDASFKGYGRIWRLPLTFVIDRNGVLRKDDWYGDPGIDVAQLERIVTPLLNSH
jgi:thiol-disulfide isomerase/thioredoxin